MLFPRWASQVVVAGLLALAPLQGGRAQGGDPADLAFWQSISNSTNPAEYQAYLQAFPNGRFAAIARLRANAGQQAAPQIAPGQQAAPGLQPQGAAPVPVADAAPDADPDAPKMTITPAQGRVGQRFTISLVNFPDTTSYDMVVIVPAGTPVMDPTMHRDQTKVLWQSYANNAKSYNNTLRDVGPFAPGRYEARWMTKLYNNEDRYENKASVAFSVR